MESIKITFGKDKTAIIKGFAIVFMILLHVFGGAGWYEDDIPMNHSDGLIRFMHSFQICVGIFVFMIALIFQLTIFILSVLAIANNSFFANGYSLVLRHAAMGESNITSSYTMNGSVLNQIRPFELFFNSFTLNLLYMITIGIIQYCFTLCSKRILGIILNFIIVGGGFCLLYIDSKLKWLMPLAHSVYTGHYDTVYNRTYCDLKYSYLYFGIIIICLLTISYKITERCSFHCIEEVDV